jgi:hypothetical protein
MRKSQALQPVSGRVLIPRIPEYEKMNAIDSIVAFDDFKEEIIQK